MEYHFFPKKFNLERKGNWKICRVYMHYINKINKDSVNKINKTKYTFSH